MYCKYCGKRIENDAKYCPGCGKSLLTDETENKAEERYHQTEYCCPVCGSRNLHILNKTDVHTSGGGYSGGKGCLGYLIFGPLGLLCGACGKKQRVSTVNKTFFVCGNCGNSFRSLEELAEERSSLKITTILLIVLGFVLLTIMIILVSATNAFNGFSLGIMILLFSFPILIILSGYVGWGELANKDKEIENLKMDMNSFLKNKK